MDFEEYYINRIDYQILPNSVRPKTKEDVIELKNYCPSCGKKLKGTENFCPSCGEKL